MQLTLEERERRAFITNSPDHPLLVEALEGDEEVRQERDDYKKEFEAADDQVTELKGKVEELEIEVDEKADTIVELREQIESAGLDLV
jgi:uncharacterized coiled-coil DUF342 family protein